MASAVVTGLLDAMSWRRGGRWLSVLSVAAFASACAAAPGFASPTAPGGARGVVATRPAPGHLIVGEAIVLPAALFRANPVGSPSLIAPSQAAEVAKAMWEQWEQALVSSNTRALSQLAVAGPLLAGTVDECALPRGRCVFETAPRPIMELHTIVPLQQAYPLFFLSEIETMQYVDAANGLPVQQPWIELQILTKASTDAPWRLQFDSGYNGVNGSVPLLLPFDLAAIGPTGEPGPRELYNPLAQQSPPVPVEQFLPLLAGYWQSFKDAGHAPAQSVFVSDGYTSGVGAQLAQQRQGSVYAGHRDTFQFGADPGAGTWQFSAAGGYPLLCGTIRDLETSIPVKGLLYQNPDESNYGIPLRSGEYRKIVTTADHETCIYVTPRGLDAVGNTTYASDVIGMRVKNAPRTSNGALGDVETAYSVLVYQINLYETKLRACVRAHAALACSSLYANRAEHEFARFERRLGTANLPARVQPQLDQLAATADELTKLFEQLTNHPPTNALNNEIHARTTTLNHEYRALVAALS
jgi:hypothetical protein